MHLDLGIIASLTRRFEPRSYLRTTPLFRRATPLARGFGSTRFASPTNAFKQIHIAKDLPTSLAEAIIRDRFEGITTRNLARSYVADW